MWRIIYKQRYRFKYLVLDFNFQLQQSVNRIICYLNKEIIKIDLIYDWEN